MRPRRIIFIDFNTIIYNVKDGIGIMAMNRPKSMNAINDGFVWELGQVVDMINEDLDVSAVIVTGGERF